MGNGTKRFNQIEAYICSLPEHQQEYAIEYYHSILNKCQPGRPSCIGYAAKNTIDDTINTIMYKI